MRGGVKSEQNIEYEEEKHGKNARTKREKSNPIGTINAFPIKYFHFAVLLFQRSSGVIVVVIERYAIHRTK